MSDLLFLCHRIPYPPDKGEKIRAWNLLRGLAERHRVHLGAFVDDREDWAGREALEQVCAEVQLVWLNRRLGKLRSLAAIATGESLSVVFYRHRRMRRWVERKLAEGMDHVFVYSSTMAQYTSQVELSSVGAQPSCANAPGAEPRPSRSDVARLREDDAGSSGTAEGCVRLPHPEPDTAHAAMPRTIHGPEGNVEAGATRTGLDQAPEVLNEAVGGAPSRRFPTLIADFVDVDSEKWRQYGETGGALGWLYRLEGWRLAAFEREYAARVDHTLLVTKSERACFLREAPELAARVHAVPNGVDTDYFSPERRGQNPFGEAPTLVFTGAMDYRPNVQAVLWFASEIFPRIREREPDAAFCIVGLRPSPAVAALAKEPGIMVTGRVADVRPYVGHAAAVVAPLTIARGVQNKVLEAMAMAKAVVCTPQALEGLEARHGEELFVASDPKPFVEAVLALIQRPDRAQELGEAAMRHVREHHGWAASVARVEELLARNAPHTAVGAQLCCANYPPAESPQPPPSEAALPREGEVGRSCTAKGGVRHPEPETSHAAAPRAIYRVAAEAAPVGAQLCCANPHPTPTTTRRRSRS